MPENESNNQNSNTWDVTRWGDPEFWKEQGIEAIVINTNDSNSVEQGFKEVASAIEQAIENIFNNKEGDKKDAE